MKSNWKTSLVTGMILTGFSIGYSQEKQSFADSIMAERDKYPTTSHFIYEIQKDSKHNFSNKNTLDTILVHLENNFPKKKYYSNEQIIQILKFTDEEMKHYCPKIKEDRFDCDDLSFIGLAVGERFKIPLWGVIVPGHFFIRCDRDTLHNSLNEKDKINLDDFNWEMTSSSIKLDKFYIEKLHIDRQSIINGTYLKNLTKKELIAVAHNNIGTYFFEKREYDLAVKSYSKAIELKSDFFTAYFNRGSANSYLKKHLSSINDYSKAILLDSNNYLAYKFRGNEYRSIGERKKAKEDFKKFREIKKMNRKKK